jgi:hypothetical protein
VHEPAGNVGRATALVLAEDGALEPAQQYEQKGYLFS